MGAGVTVRPKKHLGQHFLTSPEYARRIAHAGTDQYAGCTTVMEIGPGTGALTRHLLPCCADQLWLCEIDRESIDYLMQHFPELRERIIDRDFLHLDLVPYDTPIHVVGNFPYNISSQIVFRILEQQERVQSMHGMFQKEVARRICAPPGNKEYGIISVLTQAYFRTEYLFTVPPGAFHPPPKVDSGVMRMLKHDQPRVTSRYKDLARVVKMAFNQRRKTLSNSLKQLQLPGDHPLARQRPEQLSVEQFDAITHDLIPFPHP